LTDRFHHFDALRVFVIASQHESLSDAADQLHLTKGAVSQQIKKLEEDLGFTVFDRHPRGITLSVKGRELLSTADQAFKDIEHRLESLKGEAHQSLTIGVTSYFASRWLSPRLTGFMQQHPDIRLRIQPMIDLLNFAGQEVDLAIRWGNGKWLDCEIAQLFNSPAWPTGNSDAAHQVNHKGLEKAFSGFTLLRDRDDSNAWSEWYGVAGLNQPQQLDTLIIPDPNVRVQAVLDGQGIALNDELVDEEIASGKLFRLCNPELTDYGYFLAYNDKTAINNPAVGHFIKWILDSNKEARSNNSYEP